MFATLYHLISQRLASKMPQLQHIELYHQQYLNMQQELPMPTPACLIEFESIQWQTTGVHTQQGTLSIALHLVTEYLLPTGNYHEQQYNARQYTAQVLDMAQQLHLAMQGFALTHEQDPNLMHTTELTRTATRPENTPQGPLHIWVTTYQCTVFDTTTHRDANRVPYTLPGINISKP